MDLPPPTLSESVELREGPVEDYAKNGRENGLTLAIVSSEVVVDLDGSRDNRVQGSIALRGLVRRTRGLEDVRRVCSGISTS